MTTTKEEPKRLSWEPVRRGPVYCAPACGYGCTWASHQEAHLKGEKLVKQLTKEVGGEWEVRVWENLGWHWQVRHKGGHLTVTDYKDRYGRAADERYDVTLNPHDPHSPGYPIQWPSYEVDAKAVGSTPGAAVRALIKKVRDELERQLTLVKSFPGQE